MPAGDSSCEDEKFPRAEIEAAGYDAQVFGQKTYNGVAILARKGLAVADVATRTATASPTSRSA